LFADVELAGRREATRLELLGLEVEDDGDRGRLLIQPCGALRGTRCRIYAQRPSCCRTFECRLLQDARRGAVPVTEARAHISEAQRRIGRVNGLLERLGRPAGGLPLRERCAEALAAHPGRTPGARRARARLEAAMAAVERLIRRRFLGETAPPDPRG